MKKLYVLFCAMIAGSASFAQTIANGDMELWRSSTSGKTPNPVISIQAPVMWYGYDSLVISYGESYTPLLYSGYSGTDWKAQLFEENTITHGGAHSAKVMTLKQDTLGLVPGSLSNAVASVDIAKVIATKSLTGASSFTGGTPVTLRPTTVSAWIQYNPGMDTSAHPAVPGLDSGSLTVQAVAHIGSKDSVIGTGIINIGTSATWKQITANVTYAADTTDSVTFLRIVFSSSNGGGTKSFDSSTLYVDDVTMTGVAYVHTTPVDHTGVRSTTQSSDVKVYPNPASNTLYIDGPKNAGLSCRLYSLSGQQVINKQLAGNDAIDISKLAAGNYVYTITDATGSTVQNGKVTVGK